MSRRRRRKGGVAPTRLRPPAAVAPTAQRPSPVTVEAQPPNGRLPPGWFQVLGEYTYSAARQLRANLERAGWEVRFVADMMEGYYHVMYRRPLPQGTIESKVGAIL